MHACLIIISLLMFIEVHSEISLPRMIHNKQNIWFYDTKYKKNSDILTRFIKAKYKIYQKTEDNSVIHASTTQK